MFNCDDASQKEVDVLIYANVCRSVSNSSLVTLHKFFSMTAGIHLKLRMSCGTAT